MIEDIYNIAVYADNTQMDKSMLQFDGTVLKVSNALGPNHIYRLVLSKTRPRKVDGIMADIQGDDPFQPIGPQAYQFPWLELLPLVIAVKKEGDNKYEYVQNKREP